MASFAQAGRSNAGTKNPVTVNGGSSAVALTDTLTLHGRTYTILEWIRRGVLRTTSVSGNTVTYQLAHEPESV